MYDTLDIKSYVKTNYLMSLHLIKSMYYSNFCKCIYAAILILQILKSVFLEEWNLLMTTEVTADMAIKFKLFGSMHTIRFTDLGVASVDIYASLGG